MANVTKPVILNETGITIATANTRTATALETIAQLLSSDSGGSGSGQDGFSPTITVTNITGGHRVSITDVNGTKTFDVTNGTNGSNGVSPTVTITDITNGHRVSITDANGTKTFDVMNGSGSGGSGSDGYSPTVTVTNITGGHSVSITDVNGTKTFNVMDGANGSNGTNGTNGTDGVSPTVTVTDITNGHRVSITDVNGTKSFDVMDGSGSGGASVSIDTTLTVSGAAADAKTVGDKIDNIFTDVQSDNLFNKDDIVEGSIIHLDNTINNSDGFHAFIEMARGTYTFIVPTSIWQTYNSVGVYDSSKNYVIAVANMSATDYDSTHKLITANITNSETGLGGRYFAVNGLLSEINTLMVVKSDEYPSSYTPYGTYKTKEDLRITTNQITDYNNVTSSVTETGDGVTFYTFDLNDGNGDLAVAPVSPYTGLIGSENLPTVVSGGASGAMTGADKAKLDSFLFTSPTNGQTVVYNSTIGKWVNSTSSGGSGSIVNTDYVTPQMYGAVADGDTDDSAAIQAAINSGKSVFFPCGDYAIASPIIIDNKRFWSLNAQDAVIGYTGNDYAIKILNVRNCHINLGTVYTDTGGCVEFYSDSEDSWNQYVVLTFDYMVASTDCIHVETTGEGWSNENQIYGGHFGGGDNGVHLVRADGVHGLVGWKFYNCGIEGVTNGFLFDAGSDEICNNVIVNPRYSESFETLIKTVGTVYDCKLIAPTAVMPEFIVASPQTTRFIIDAPIGNFWDMDDDEDKAYVRGYIKDGVLMGEKPVFEVATPETPSEPDEPVEPIVPTSWETIYDGSATIEESEVNYTMFTSNDVINLGDVYRVTWNGVASTLTAKSSTINGSTYVIIGNPGAEDSDLDDGSGLTYYGWKFNETSFAFATTESPGTITLKVEKGVA